MKARVATVLSLTGVLVAGSAAALVNTQVLRSAAPSGNTVVRLVDDSSSTASSEAGTDPSVTTIQTVVPSTQKSELAAYQVGTSGLVTVDSAGDVLRVDSAKPADGWQLIGIEQPDSLNVKVLFQQGDTVVEFRANLLFDKITPSVSSYLASQGPGTSNTTGSSGTTNTSTGGSTRTTVDDDDDDDSKAPTTSDDSGKGRGGRGGGDDPSDDD